MENNINEDIKNLKEITDLVKEEIKNNDKNTSAILDITDLKSLYIVVSELETYKKIAEKLAEEIYKVSYYASCDSDYISQRIYNWKEPKDNEKEGIRIAIEWAREEVEKESK